MYREDTAVASSGYEHDRVEKIVENPGPIYEAVTSLEDAANRVGHILAQVEDHLATVLMARDPRLIEMGLAGEKDDDPSPLRARIDQTTLRLNSLADRLRGLNDRIEL